MTTLETLLATCAVMGCFVYPAAQAARATGKKIAQESERGQDVMLEQKQSR